MLSSKRFVCDIKTKVRKGFTCGLVIRAGEIQTKMIQEQSNRVYVRCDVRIYIRDPGRSEI